MSTQEGMVPSPVFKIEKAEKSAKPTRMQWSKLHDESLNRLTAMNKGHNWNEIARVMCEKFPDVQFTSKKCRARWKNCINPEIIRQYLNNAEELLLITFHSIYKNKWSKICKRLPNRNSNILRNSFYSSLRKTIQQIALCKKPAGEMNPLLFVQNLYICIFTIELLELSQPPPHKNPIVPLYIYQYVKEKKIDKAMCINYVKQIKDVFLASCPNRSQLVLLKDYTYDQLTSKFFTKLVAIVKQSVKQNCAISDDFMLDIIEGALAINSVKMTASPPQSFTIPPPFPSFPVMQQPAPQMCYMMPGEEAYPQMFMGHPMQHPMVHLSVNPSFSMFPRPFTFQPRSFPFGTIGTQEQQQQSYLTQEQLLQLACLGPENLLQIARQNS